MDPFKRTRKEVVLTERELEALEEVRRLTQSSTYSKAIKTVLMNYPVLLQQLSIMRKEKDELRKELEKQTEGVNQFMEAFHLLNKYWKK